MKRKSLCLILALVMLFACLPLASAGSADPVEAFFKGGKIATPDTAPYIVYRDTYDDGEPCNSQTELYYNVTEDILAMNEEYNSPGPEEFCEKYGIENVAEGIQIDAKFDDGEWLSSDGDWDIFDYGENKSEWNLCFLLSDDFSPDDTSTYHYVTQSWLVYFDGGSEYDEFYKPLVKTITVGDDEYSENISSFDLANHTIYYRYREYVTFCIDGDESVKVFSGWSPVTSIGKNGTQVPLTLPEKTSAPVLSDFSLNKQEDSEYYNPACILTVADDVYAAEKYFITEMEGFEPFIIEAQVRANGGEWEDAFVANASWIQSGWRSMWINGKDIDAADKISIRMRLICSVEGYEYLTTPWSNIVGNEVQWRKGYVDTDDDIDVADARLALRYAIRLDPADPESRAFYAADITGDGNISVEDARFILRAAIKLDDPAVAWAKYPA